VAIFVNWVDLNWYAAFMKGGTFPEQLGDQ